MKKNIVTGQQVGLLSGPLYTAYKVLGAMKYAHEIKGQAIYWLETNDADFNEINHVDYINANGELQTLTWEKDSKGYSCGSIEIDTSVMDLLNTFFDSLRQTEFTTELKVLAFGCYVPERTLGEASMLLASQLFGRLGIELFDPSQKEFKTFIKPYLLNEAERTKPGAQCNLFCMVGKRRMAVFKDQKGYHLRYGKRVNLEKYDLVPNVQTRNVCQDAYFNTHTYVAGPGEIAYIKDLDANYEFHGVRKAEILPRMSLLLLEPKAQRLLRKHNLSFQDVLGLEKAALLKKVLKEQSGFDYKALTQQARQLTKNYITRLQEIGVNLSKTERSLFQAIKENLGEQRAQEKARMDHTLKTIETLSDMLTPLGEKQERMFNIFYYMNLYGGLDFVDWLYERYDISLETLEIEL